MTVKLAEMSAEDRAELIKQVAVELGTAGSKPETAAVTPPPDLLAQFNLQGASDEVVAAIRQTMLEQYDVIQQKAQREAAELIANVRREANISDLCAKVTGGDKDIPYGLPVKGDELKTWLLSLDKKQAEFAQSLLLNVAKSGVVDFREHGHGRDVAGGTEKLPAEIAAKLDDGELKVADLSSPMLNLGSLAQYDLSKWSK